jgi:hypothetical protein
MAKYWIGFSAFATTTSNQTAMKIIGAASKALECVEVAGYGSGTTAPADVSHQFNAGFLSNAGAGTAGVSPTPEPLDQGSNVSDLTAGTKFSAEPTTYNTNVFPLLSFNQRGGMRWGVTKGEGYKTQGALTGLSFGVRVISSVAGAVDGNSFWWE